MRRDLDGDGGGGGRGVVAGFGAGGAALVAAIARTLCTAELSRPHSCTRTMSPEQFDDQVGVGYCCYAGLDLGGCCCCCPLCLKRKNQPLLPQL